MAREKQWQYVLFPEEDRPKRFQKIQEDAPEMLRRLQELPQANGETDQARERMGDFYSVWKGFRIRAMKCAQKGWLRTTFYETPAWRNYEALKKQSSRYKMWKTRDNKRRWEEMPEDQRERRRKQQREAGKGKREARWFDDGRAFALAKRCLKDDPGAKVVTYGPVIRLIRKHVTPEASERFMTDCVRLAIACLTSNPHDPQSVKSFEGALKWCLPPGLDQASRDLSERRKELWRQYWRETWEASHDAAIQEVLDKV